MKLKLFQIKVIPGKVKVGTLPNNATAYLLFNEFLNQMIDCWLYDL